LNEGLDDRELIEKLSVATEAFVRNLAPRGIVPKILSAVTADRRHFLLDLKGLGIDRGEEMNFLRWLCAREGVRAHATTRPFEVPDAPEALAKRFLMVMLFAGDLGRELEIPFWPDQENQLTYGETTTTNLSPEQSREHLFNYSKKTDAGQLQRWNYGSLWSRLKEKVAWRTL
jgi:hypothetical protein